VAVVSTSLAELLSSGSATPCPVKCSRSKSPPRNSVRRADSVPVKGWAPMCCSRNSASSIPPAPGDP